MKYVEIKPDIFWVGAIDWAVRDFHGYVTPKGTTYNNYLIIDEQVTLIDTVKSDFSRVTIDNIRNLVDPSKIVNLIVNHIEPDHASRLDKIMMLAHDATIHITDKGKKHLVDITNVRTGWLMERKSQIESVEYKDIEPRNKCERCGDPTDELPRWMKLCGFCNATQ